MSQLSDITTAYNEEVTEQQEKLLDYGSKLNKLERTMYEAAGITDLDSIFTNVDAGGLGYYETKDGETRLTTRGQQFVDKVLNAGIDIGDGNVMQFADYLYETDPELYEFYTQNLGDVRSLIGGLKPEDIKYDESEYDEKIKQDIGVKTYDYYDISKTIKNEKFISQNGIQYKISINEKQSKIPKQLSDIKGTPGDIIEYQGGTYLRGKDRWFTLKKI